MPYSETKDLPETVKEKIKDEKRLRQFMAVVNSQLKAGKSEAVSFASAWAAVQKNQIDSTSEIPSDVRAKLPSKEAKEIWLNEYSRSYSAGATKEVSTQRAWDSLKIAGYSPDEDGEWIPLSESLFDKFMKWINKEEKMEEENFEFVADVIVKNEDQSLVYGWASVIEEGGQVLVDKQGDAIGEQDLIEAAHDFISESRAAKAMHKGDQVGEIVESIVFSSDVQKALNIDLGKVGWFIGMKIHDDNIFAKFKKGEFSAFSIGGHGQRIPIA